MRRIFYAILLILVLAYGCNIFSPFHNEGESENPKVLLEDAIAALERNDPETSYEYLEKAKQLAPDDPYILYYHAIARIRKDDINFENFIEPFYMHPSPPQSSLVVSFGVQQNTLFVDTLFTNDDEEIRILLEAFIEVTADYEAIIAGLNSGRLDYTDFPFSNDTYLSCGIAKIITNLILIIDEDHKGPDFKRNPNYELINTYEGFETSQPPDLTWENKAELREKFRQGLNYLWFYYYYSTNTSFELPFVLPPSPCPDVDETITSGQTLKAVYNGLLRLFQEIL